MPVISTPSPSLILTAGAQNTLTITPTLQSGQSLTNFQSFTLTLYQDPYYPRQTGASIVNANTVADPVVETWQTACAVSGSVSGSQLVFIIPSTVALSSGANRYSATVWGLSTTYGPQQLLPESWVSVNAQ